MKMYQILIVDDEYRVIDDLERNIDWKGLGIGHVIRAESVQEALELYDLYLPEMILSDIEMVGKSGLDFLEAIQKKNGECRFVFLTCHPEFDYMRKAIQLGCSDYLLKPVDYQELTDIIRRMLREMEQKELEEIGDPGMSLKGEHDLVLRVKKYISDHMMEKIKVTEIADQLGCSESMIARAFKNETGWSIVEYITVERITRAGELLRNTDWNIQLIAHMCGYDDSAYFSRVFKKITGVAPTSYQKNGKRK